MKYEFIRKHKSEHSIKRLCRILKVSSSGYYAWDKRPESQHKKEDRKLSIVIKEIFDKSKRRYGSPRIWISLRQAGYCCSRNRVARLMREKGLSACKPRRKTTSSPAEDEVRPVANLLNQDFSAEAPNQKWVSDITYIPTKEGWLYLAAVLDLFSRKVIGWSMSGVINSHLVMEALKMAIHQRRSTSATLYHSDQGIQYCSRAMVALVESSQLRMSMSRRGNCYDNAVMESFWASLKRETSARKGYTDRLEARGDLFRYIEGFYNRVRLHSSLGYLSPDDYERKYQLIP